MRKLRIALSGINFGLRAVLACQERPMVGQEVNIDALLRRLRYEVIELPMLTSMIAEEPPDVRDLWHWQWDDLIGQLNSLCEQRRLQLMTAEQEQAFDDMLRQLEVVRPDIEALGVCVPEDASITYMAAEVKTGESVEA